MGWIKLELTAMHRYKNQSGFTLIEIMIAMTISVIITSAIYQVFHSQQRSYLIQDRVAEMQQNLRAGLYMMARELRSAGYDPELTGNFGIVTNITPPADTCVTEIDYADNKNIIAFTMDSDEDPGVVNNIREEQVVYRLCNNQLQRYNVETTVWEIVADNIDALDFVLVDQSGAVTTDPANVAAVEIALLVRTDVKDIKYTNTQIYRNKRGQDICLVCTAAIPDPENELRYYRRRVLSTTVGIRNS